MDLRGVGYRNTGWPVAMLAVALAVASGGTARAGGRHDSAHTPHAGRLALGSVAANYSAIVIDGNSGRELYGINEDAPRHPASITKVMTLYLLFEQMEKGRVGLDTMLQVSAHAAGQSPTKLGVPAGSTVSVDNAIKAIVTRSANDMAVAVAENLAGDEIAFARLMTDKAHALGMRHTFYHNASGLPDMRQITTARDLTILGRAIHDRFPRYYKFFSTPSFVYRGETITSHNHLMARMEGMDGIKTGYTNASGFNLLSSVQRGSRHVVAVVMGGRSAASRDSVMEGLLESHFELAQAGPGARVAEGGPIEAPAATPHLPPAPVPVERTPPQPAERPAFDEGHAAIADGDDEAAENAPDDHPAPTPAERHLPRAPSLIAPEMGLSTPDRSPDRVRLARAEDRPKPAFVAGAPDSGRGAAGASTDGSTNHRAGAAPSVGQAVATATPSSLHWVVGPQPVRMGAAADATPSDPRAGTAKSAPISFGSPEDRTGATAEADEGRPAAARGGVVIQIGATDNAGAAAELLSRAKSEGRSALASAKPFTERVQKGDATLYRARFAGLEPAEAEAACRALKRSGFACFATRD